MTRLKTYFMNMKIRNKLFLSMLLIAALSSLCISVLCYFYFARDYEKQMDIRTQGSMNTLVKTFNMQAANFTTDINQFLSSLDLRDVVRTVRYADTADISHMRGHVIDNLEQLQLRNNLIHNILLLDYNGQYYSGASYTLREECRTFEIWPDNVQPGIRWLSARRSPFTVPSKMVVPVSFPLGFGRMGTIVEYEMTAQPLMRLVVLFDYEKFNLTFHSDDGGGVSAVYLASDKAQPLTLTEQSLFYEVASDLGVQEQIAGTSKVVKREVRHGGKTYYLYADTAFNGLKVVTLTSREALLADLDKIMGITLLTLLLGVLVALLMSAVLSKITTKPINKLVGYVRQIEQGRRDTRPQTRYSDEIGMLSGSITSMAQTIECQMRTIKREERERAGAQIALLTSQINPHFLYNTLDCIHWEILAGNAGGAAGMVESLGSFLRLGLSGGGSLISLSGEVRHAEQYVRIMNLRMASSIRFSAHVEEGLQERKLPKQILQPLVENSIKHGFRDMSGENLVLEPRLYVSARRGGDGMLRIAVEDNGCGIDEERAKASLNCEEGCGIGLSNVYRRLKGIYGDRVEVRFTCGPYFRNIVELVFPDVELEEERADETA